MEAHLSRFPFLGNDKRRPLLILRDIHDEGMRLKSKTDSGSHVRLRTTDTQPFSVIQHL